MKSDDGGTAPSEPWRGLGGPAGKILLTPSSSSPLPRRLVSPYRDDDDDDDDDEDDGDDCDDASHPPPLLPASTRRRRRHHWQQHWCDDGGESYDSIDQPILPPPPPPPAPPPAAAAAAAAPPPRLASSSPPTTTPTPTPAFAATTTTTTTLAALPVENLAHAASYLSLRDARSLASSCISIRSSLATSRCAAVDVWMAGMAGVFPAVFAPRGGGRGVVAFVEDLRLPVVPAFATTTTTTTTTPGDDGGEGAAAWAVGVNLPLIAGLVPRRYPRRIDPRTLAAGDCSESDSDYEDDDGGGGGEDDDDDDDDDDDEENVFMMMMFGGVNDDRRRDRPRRQRRGRRGGGGGRRRRSMRSRSAASDRLVEFESFETAVASTDRAAGGGGGIAVEAGAADGGDGGDDGDGNRPGDLLILPVIRFVGDRVGTGERCVRSDRPFPPTCRRVAMAGGGGGGGDRSSPMSGFLRSLRGGGCEVETAASDGPPDDEEMVDDDHHRDEEDDIGSAPASPGQLIMSKCTTIIGKLSSLRGGLRRASPSTRLVDGRDRIKGDEEEDVVAAAGHNNLRPFVIPTVISETGRGLVIDVTPRLVAYFEVTIVKMRSSSAASAAAAFPAARQQRVAFGGNDAFGTNYRILEEAAAAGDEDRRRQRQRRPVNNRQAAAAWMPAMMMPVLPFPAEIASMIGAVDWDRLPLGAGMRRGGGGGGYGGGALAHQREQEHERRRFEIQRRRERERREFERWHIEQRERWEAQRWERERQRREWQERVREGQRRGHRVQQRRDADAREDRRPQEQEQERMRGGRRHECVAIGLSTRRFSPADKMPGWDAESFGYHGDDGGIYHGRGEMLRRYGPSYGPGDTVGCGLEYGSRRVFFVKNGVFLGYAFGEGGRRGDDDVAIRGALSGEMIDCGLYPTVGVDTECPISVNFGERPFMFDLRDFVAAASSSGGKY